MDLLPEVWREAGRHVEIGEALEAIFTVARATLPLDTIVVRQVDLDRRLLETVALASVDRRGDLLGGRTACPPEGLRHLLTWWRQGTVFEVSASGGERPPSELVLPAGESGSWVLGPLGREGRTLGVVLCRPAAHARTSLVPFVRDLLEPLSVALETHARFHELARLREALEADKRALLSRLDRQEVSDAIVGEETGLREAMERVAQVAPTDVPVLIMGDTGTGKEVIARAIHGRSQRASGPIVRVNCGALPPGLVDSELFGHERGSFTGAISTRQGWFERADGGTLFLDEVGELPLEAQVRLLRVLQDGTFERVGGHKAHRVDVRVVAATHRDLLGMVRQGRFREDLWYRISVFPIRLPALRERPEDIPTLATHFAGRAGRRLSGVPLPISQDDVDLLLAYPWPGNVRELAAVIERAAILGNGRELRLGAALGGVPPGPGPVHDHDSGTGSGERLLTLDQAMTQHVERALHRTRGRIEGPHGAARLLAINPHTLRARMRKLRIDANRFRGRAADEVPA